MTITPVVLLERVHYSRVSTVSDGIDHNCARANCSDSVVHAQDHPGVVGHYVSGLFGDIVEVADVRGTIGDNLGLLALQAIPAPPPDREDRCLRRGWLRRKLLPPRSALRDRSSMII